MARWISGFCLASALATHALPSNSPRDIRLDRSTSSADTISLDLILRSTDGDPLPAVAWSSTTLEDGTRVVTSPEGKTLRVESVSSVAQQEAVKLGFPGYDGSPPGERAAHAGYDSSPFLRERAVRQKHYRGTARASCAITGEKERTIELRVNFDEEQRSVSIVGSTLRTEIRRKSNYADVVSS